MASHTSLRTGTTATGRQVDAIQILAMKKDELRKEFPELYQDSNNPNMRQVLAATKLDAVLTVGATEYSAYDLKKLKVDPLAGIAQTLGIAVPAGTRKTQLLYTLLGKAKSLVPENDSSDDGDDEVTQPRQSSPPPRSSSLCALLGSPRGNAETFGGGVKFRNVNTGQVTASSAHPVKLADTMAPAAKPLTSSSVTKIMLESRKVTNKMLKEMCSSRSLGVSGKKDDLVMRLVGHNSPPDQDEVNNKIESIRYETMFANMSMEDKRASVSRN